jgi:hypothetical protein
VSRAARLAQEIRRHSKDLASRSVGDNSGWVHWAIHNVVVKDLQTWFCGKQFGVLASAKIALNKAVTLDDLEKIAAKLESAPVE